MLLWFHWWCSDDNVFLLYESENEIIDNNLCALQFWFANNLTFIFHSFWCRQYRNTEKMHLCTLIQYQNMQWLPWMLVIDACSCLLAIIEVITKQKILCLNCSIKLMYKYTLFGCKYTVFKCSWSCVYCSFGVCKIMYRDVQHRVLWCCSIYQDTQNLRTDTMCCYTCAVLCSCALGCVALLLFRFGSRLGVSDDALLCML